MSKIGGIEMGLPLSLTSTVLKSLATIFDEPLRRMEGYELCKLAFERKDHKEAVRLLRLQDPSRLLNKSGLLHLCFIIL